MRCKVYLAGPIADCTDSECFDWRDKAIKLLGKGNVFDPTRRDYRKKKLTKDDRFQLVADDLEDINESDAVLVNCWKSSWGTPMEIVHSWNRMKYIVAVVPNDNYSPWIDYHADKVVKSVEEAVKLIKKEFGDN